MRRILESIPVGLAAFLLLSTLWLVPSAKAQFRSSYASQGQAGGQRPAGQALRYGGAVVYPEFRSNYGAIRWIKDQMPLRVYISHGLSIDGIIDPQLGAPVANVNNLNNWPDLLANILQNPEQLKSLPVAQGFTDQQYQAAVEGISSWKPFEREGLFSYALTDNPEEADIYVFWVHHFVDKMGLALFAGDIRGYTAKRSFPYKAIVSGGKADFKPVLIMLRTTESNGISMPFAKMKAAAAHEFGHALGIEGHSSFATDLMSVYYGRGAISPNDAATIRYLYHLTPDLIP